MKPELVDEKAVYNIARRIESPQARAEYLEQVCGDRPEVVQRVADLLRVHDEEQSFLEAPPVALGEDVTLDQPITERPGTVIGRYKLLEQIGEGGFGVVFMAEQQEPVRRKVALKIIKPGMDTKEVIARFEAERQALALMDHPNIAKVLDAGTVGTACQTGPEHTSTPGDSGTGRQGATTAVGRPFFVMELVKGIPITEYCEHADLAPRERLEVFLSVCHAVQHAHQKGVIHRDIKPTNVMVTLHDDAPVVKVIDFGVAKAIAQRLTEKTLFTRFSQMVGTPLYMSPEQTQMSGLDVDTRRDIYSLGVLLYELLTGTTPFEKERFREAAYDDLLKIIREEDPPKPSARISTLEHTATAVSAHRRSDPKKLSALVRGELDWIVMRAMEKDRTRRYESASSFAADVQRYLDDEPVEACPPSVGYRIKKYARRNKAMLAAASMVAMTLLIGLVGTTSQAFRANAERDVAKTQRDRAVEAQELADARLQRALDAEQDAQRSRKRAENRSEEVTRLLASSYVDRAQALCEQGEIGRGMLWFAHSLQTTLTDATGLDQVIRTNLAAWGQQLHRLRMVVQHPSPVVAVALTPDGSRILTACGDAKIRLWDADSGRLLRESDTLQGDWGASTLPGGRSLVFSPDGSRILTGSYQGTAHVLDAATLQQIGEPLQHALAGESVRQNTSVDIVAFSPDGSRLVTSCHDRRELVRLWDIATLEPIGEPFSCFSKTVAFCPGGLRVLVSLPKKTSTAKRRYYQLWDFDSREPVGPPVQMATATAAAISPDGSIVATALNEGGHINLWYAATGEAVTDPIVHGGVVYSLAFSSNGSRLLSGGNTRATMVWDVATGAPIGTPLRQQSTAYSVAWSEDGKRVVTGSEDGSARLWELAQDLSVGRPVQHEDPIVAAGYSPDGLCILTERDDELQLQDAASGKAIGESFPRQRELGAAADLIFSPDGSSFLMRYEDPELRDATTGKLLGKLPSGYHHRLVFSPDGSRILGAVGGGLARLWDATTLEPIGPCLQHTKTIRPVAFSPDGSRILTGSYDGTTQLWDGATLRPLGEPLVHHSEVKALAYGPDGKHMLVGFADGTVRLWDLGARAPEGAPLHHQNIVSSVAFSPDGSRFLTCSLDQTAQLWETGTQKPIGPRLKHHAWWPTCSFSPDGTELLMTGWDGTVQLWRAPAGPLEGDLERILLWTQVVTGLELDESDGIGALDGSAWQERYQRLQELGGPPTTASLPAPLPPAETDFSQAMQLAIRGRNRAQRGQCDQAADDFAMAIELSDNSRTLRIQISHWLGKLADDCLDSGSYETCEYLSGSAIAILKKLVEEHPNDIQHRVKRARHYDRLVRLFESTNRPKDADDALRERTAAYVELAGDCPSEWRAREILTVRGDFPSEGVDRKNLAIRQVNKGMGAQRWGRFDEADKYFASAWILAKTVIVEARDQPERLMGHELDGNVVGQCHLQLARIQAYTGRDREALASFGQALERIRPYGAAYAHFSKFLLASSDPDIRDPQRALAEAKKAVDLQSDNAICWSALGRAYYRTGDYAAAVSALDKSISGVEGGFQFSTGSFESTANAFYLAMAQWHIGNQQEALRWYDQGANWAGRYAANEELRRLRAETADLLGVTDRAETNKE